MFKGFEIKKFLHNKRNAKYAVFLVIGVFIFYLGVLFGNGTINIGGKSATTGLPSHLDYSSLDQVYQALKNNYYNNLTSTQILDGLKHGLAESTGDPYTAYFTPKEAADFNNELNQSISGVGIELGKDASGNVQVISPIDGAPAATAGIKSLDIIASVDSKSTSGMSIDAVVNEIRGTAGTKVTLGIVRGNNNLSFTLTRQQISIPTVTYKILDGNIGYLKITTFGNNTTELANKAANYFADNKVSKIILDLRDNPGGLLDAAVNVASLWLPENDLVLQEKRGDVVLNSYYSNGNQTLKGIPTAILINGGSASASEILTGALKDNNAAYVIGEKSYGKGVVQQLINFPDGSQLKVTVASWYRPNGKNINKLGITPDKTVTLSDTDVQNNNDTQLNSAIDYLTTK